MNLKIYFFFFLLLFITNGCFNRELRGKVFKSKDNSTYLIIKNKDFKDCIVFVDGGIWPHEIGQKGLISPGIHKIKCGGLVEIFVKKGTTFVFDYWGP
jgi:hypothetical protein